jgi:uncharacterized surface protein with fasciclin (FAS1) repeats
VNVSSPISVSKNPLTRVLAGATALVAVPALTLATSQQAVAAPAAQENLVRTAAATGQFKTLLALSKQAGLVSALSGPGPLTLFAPTDSAFKAVPKAALDKLADDRAALRRVLLYHVVKGNVPAERVVELRSARTLAGPRISIRVRGGSVFLNGSTKVVKTDIDATNGTIHVINKVLLPPKG